jgi:hypothetical protein
MLKSFILAATSIVCILSTVNIVDAKVSKTNKAANKAVNRELTCENPVKPSPQYNQFASKNPSFKADLKAICKIINASINSINDDSLKREASLSNNNNEELHAIEIKDIRIIEWGNNGSGKPSKIKTEMDAIQRIYLWDLGLKQWKLSTTKNYVDSSTFSNEGGEWKQTEHAVHGTKSK